MAVLFDPILGALRKKDEVDLSADYDWTGTHTFQAETHFDAPITISGTEPDPDGTGVVGWIKSDIADVITNTHYLFKPTSTISNNPALMDIRDANDNTIMSLRYIGAGGYGIEVLGRNTSGDGIMNVTASATGAAGTLFNLGINFIPTFGGAGSTVGAGYPSMACSYNTLKKGTSATWTNAHGIDVETNTDYGGSPWAAGDTIQFYAGKIFGQGGGGLTMGDVHLVRGVDTAWSGKGATTVIPKYYGLKLDNIGGIRAVISKLYLARLTPQTNIATVLGVQVDTLGVKAFLCGTNETEYMSSDTLNNLDLHAAADVIVHADFQHTGTNLGFYSTTAVAQATTGGAAAAFVANTSNINDDTATFDGYTIGQVVKALRNVGLLA